MPWTPPTIRIASSWLDFYNIGKSLNAVDGACVAGERVLCDGTAFFPADFATVCFEDSRSGDGACVGFVGSGSFPQSSALLKHDIDTDAYTLSVSHLCGELVGAVADLAESRDISAVWVDFRQDMKTPIGDCVREAVFSGPANSKSSRVSRRFATSQLRLLY